MPDGPMQPYCPLRNLRCVGRNCAWAVVDIEDGGTCCAVATLASALAGMAGEGVAVPTIDRRGRDGGLAG